jgi:uncharacterized protein
MFIELKKELIANKQAYLRVKVIPGAPRTEIKDTMADGTIKIAVAAAPEKGKANLALIKFLAEEFGVPKNNITIISGATDRVKLIKISSI